MRCPSCQTVNPDEAKFCRECGSSLPVNCSNCGHEDAIFGAGGADRIVEDFGVRLLGRLPLDAQIREQTDSGRPTVVADPDSPITQSYREAAWNIGAAQAAERVDHSSKFGSIVVEEAK